MEVKEVLLPGVGLRYEFDNRDGDRIGVIARRNGDFEVVLYAADLDAMEAKVRAAGAEIISRESFEGGRRFHFRDPNGNEIAVWTKG